MKSNIAAGAITGLIFLASCSTTENSPGLEFMPDMYRSPSYETYGSTTLSDSADMKFSGVFKNGMTARKPVEGTIAFSGSPEDAAFNFSYAFPNTTEGYEQAGASLANPVVLNEAVLAQGKDLFGKYCTHCHGEKGDGQGTLVKREKFPGILAYWNMAGLNQGKMFHTMQYGKGLMGSHASQLTAKERWILVHYVQSLINAQSGGEEKSEVAPVQIDTINSNS